MPVSSDADARTPAAAEGVLGFDVRLLWEGADDAWTPERRRRFLLREDVARSLSVDPLVWPSIFGDGLNEGQCTDLGLGRLGWPTWRGSNAGLWDDLTAMQAALSGIAAVPRQVISIGLVSAQHGDSIADGPPYLGHASPSVLGGAWDLLGFDVADRFLTSGLTNCGYDGKDKVGIAAQWAHLLNEHHLFHRAADALGFCLVADSRVPEHAPFLAFSIRAPIGPSR